ncbi:hypothetical protein E2C01_054545 [Portunus trituberculatus]|uniref:Uncharacterized protein n=1 Tax=Portunus trituberculatus TaxID=210409 RepID=A0A5B7GSC3_PORTR|nr:hypothetical protein [Portunus trituberculatus]
MDTGPPRGKRRGNRTGGPIITGCGGRHEEQLIVCGKPKQAVSSGRGLAAKKKKQNNGRAPKPNTASNWCGRLKATGDRRRVATSRVFAPPQQRRLADVNVRQANLASLLKTAESLKIKGLAVPEANFGSLSK